MKKLILCMVMVMILSITVFRIQSLEVFLPIKNMGKAKPVSQMVKTEDATKTSGKKAAEKKLNLAKEKNVRIVILNNNYTSIYYSKVELSGKHLTVYYGKNYRSKKTVEQVLIDGNSRYFRNNDVIKIEAKDKLQWENYGNGAGKVYAGAFYIYRTSSGLVVVNQVKMNDYVAAVISSEIGADSPMEALKAQAVCARTYIAESNPKEYKKYRANGDDSTSYQVYNRIAPTKACQQAAQETNQVIMTYRGKAIRAYYFSTSCGYTTNYRIWGRKKLNYLNGCSTLKNPVAIDSEEQFSAFIKSKPKSYESQYPFYRWRVYATSEQLENAIYRTTGVSVGAIRKIEVNARGVGGIAAQITIYGSKSQIVMNNQNQIRRALNSYYSDIHLSDGSTRSKMELLPSAFITIETVWKNSQVVGFQIYGGGFGHGSGMSQNGAIALANKGKTYQQILKFYYQKIKLTSNW